MIQLLTDSEAPRIVGYTSETRNSPTTLALKEHGQWMLSCSERELPGVQAMISTFERTSLRPEVLAFARAMELKLQANDHKGGWQSLSRDDLSELLIGELVELLAALHLNEETLKSIITDACASLDWTDFQSNPSLEALDVANIAMMIHDNLTNARF